MVHKHLMRTFRDHRRVTACGVLHAPLIKLDANLHRHPVITKMALRRLHFVPHTFHPSRHQSVQVAAMKEVSPVRQKTKSSAGKHRVLESINKVFNSR